MNELNHVPEIVHIEQFEEVHVLHIRVLITDDMVVVEVFLNVHQLGHFGENEVVDDVHMDEV